MLENFKKDIHEGLSSSPKRLPSKYFYDKKGDALFQQIMHLKEYYLTKSELEIFQNQADSIIEAFDKKENESFELIELGAGDGLKTKELLNCLLNKQCSFNYIPIDISQNALNQLEDSLSLEMPNLTVTPKQGDYFGVLAELKKSKLPKVVLFLGSNIGNMSDHVAIDFIYQLGSNLKKGDKLLLGVDLIKAQEIVLPAYNDSQGVTRDFNLNLLHRINQELGGNFDISSFKHTPEYFEDEGIARSYLQSKIDQEVFISSLNKTYTFLKGEKILMEISRKYNDTILGKLIEHTDFKVTQKFVDEKKYFANYILTRVE